MKIRHLHLSSGTTEGTPLLIDARWSAKQAGLTGTGEMIVSFTQISE